MSSSLFLPSSSSSSPPPTSTTDTLRNQLSELDREGQALRLTKSKLDDRLKVVKGLIAQNINNTRVKMKELDADLAAQQGVKPFQTFLDNLDGDDEIVEGLCRQMQGNAALRIAVHAIANGRGTADHKIRVAAALMTELAGDATQMIQNIATMAQQRVNGNVEDGDGDGDVDLGSSRHVDAMSTSDDNPTFLHERVVRQPSPPNAMSSSHRRLTSTRSPSIKSEDSTGHHQPTPNRATPNMYASQTNNNSKNASATTTNQYSSANMFAQPSVATAAMYAQPASTATASAGVTTLLSGNTLNNPTPTTASAVRARAAATTQPPRVQVPDTSSRMLRLESAFPGLLDSINSRPAPAKKRPAPPPSPTPPPPERPATPARAIKRNKTSKEPSKSTTL